MNTNEIKKPATQMKSFFKRIKWERFGLGLILAVLLILNFRWGYFILGNDNYSPEENPTLNFKRYLFSPAWRQYRGLGVPSDAEQVDIFRSGLFAILEKVGIPLWLLSQASIWLTFFIGPWSGANLGEWLFSRFFGERGKKEAFILGGVFYFTNLLTVWLFFSPLKPFIFAWGFLPFFLWRSLVFLEKNSLSSFISFLVSLILLTLSAIIPTVFLVEIGAVFVFFCLFGLQKIKFRKILTVFLFFIIFQFFWLAPFVFYVISNSSALQSSYINRMITPNTFQNESKENVLQNLLRYYTFWLKTKTDDNKFLFPNAPLYQEKPWQVISWLVPVFAVSGIVLLLVKRKWRALPLVFLLLTGAWIIKGANPPFGEAFVFWQNKIPLFKQAFRWSSSKLWPFLDLSLPFLASFAIVFLLLNRLPKFFKFLLLILIISAQLTFVLPFWKKELVGKGDFTKIPSAYFKLSDYLEENDPQGRIYVAPEANMLYFRDYNWNFYGSVFLSYLLPNPIFEKALITGSMENEQAYLTLVNAYYSENPEIFAQALQNYKVEWVLSDRSVSSLGSGYDYNWPVHEKVVNNNPLLEKKWADDFLTLYAVKKGPIPEEELVYWNHDWNSFQKVRLFWPPKQLIASDNPNLAALIYPLLIRPDKISLENENLVLNHQYQGKGTTFSLDTPFGWAKLPIQTQFDQDKKEIIFTPAVPSFWKNDEFIFDHRDLAGLEMTVEDNVGWITLENMVWDFRNQPSQVFDLEFGRLTEPGIVKLWKNEKAKEEKIHYITLEKESLISLDLTIKAKNPGWYNLCLESNYLKKCLNQEVSFWADSSPKSTKILVNRSLYAQDTLTVWLPEKGEFQIEKLSCYQRFEPVLIKNLNLTDVRRSFPHFLLQPKDQLTVKIPIIKGENSYFWLSGKDSFSIPEVFTSGNLQIENNSLLIQSLDEPSGFYLKFFPLEKSNWPITIAVGANNLYGIPLDINFRDVKKEYKIYSQRLGWEKEDAFAQILITPEELHNYILEVYLYGQGAKPSLNQLKFLFFQPLPVEWTRIKMVPREISMVDFRATGQAYHQNWQGKSGELSLEKVKIDGWEQGFILPTANSQQPRPQDNRPLAETAIFWPNYLSWLGYILDLILIGAGIGYLVWPKKTASPAKD